MIDYPHRRTRYLYYLVAALLITSRELLAAIRTMLYSMEYFLSGCLASTNKRLLAFLSLSTLRRTTLLTAGFDERSSAAAIATAGKLIAQHFNFSSKINQLLLESCVLCVQRLILRYQFFAGSFVHISHLDN